MSKTVASLPWVCARCRTRSSTRPTKRWISTASPQRFIASPVAIPEHPPAYAHSDAQTTSDETTLRRVFDSAPFWKDFSTYGSSKRRRSAGLLSNRYLTRADGFQEFAAVTLMKCRRVVDKVLSYQTVEEYKRVARDLDRLSDLLCRVIDMSDFVRSVHPDPKVQHAASLAYSQMFQYMNVLNTTPDLNDLLKRVSAIPEVWNSWSEEEQTVATILMRDFSHSAIDMQQEQRDNFVSLSSEIADTGADFVDNMSADQSSVQLPSSALKGMDPRLVKQLTQWGRVTLPMVGAAPITALRTVEDAEVRRAIYTAHRTSSKDNLHRLERLLQRRAKIARLSGFDSYGHLTLSEKMSGSPEAVTSFLNAVAQANAPLVQNELRDLQQLKAHDPRANSSAIAAWDRDYYASKLMISLRSKARAPDFLSSYFSLGTVMQGLSRIYNRLYGIRFVPQETQPGETWNDDVRRLDVIDEKEGRIAVIYCDLFQRRGKSPNPAHFTLRCSRKISDEEMEDATALANDPTSIFDTPEEVANDGLVTARGQDGSLYQLPTIALICDFAISSNRSQPALLTFREVRTLWHEMGHALHSICGRTQLQNVAGTRCPTDFAELPSVLNESFASAPELLKLWARHWDTDEPLDVDRIRHKVAIDKRMEGAEIESQILLGMLDQRLHSSLPLSWTEGSDASSQVFRDVWSQYSSVPEPDGTSYHGFFGHLFGYGATYYAYLFDRAIAGKIWKDVFQRTEAGALDPEAGRRYREEVLKWGGSRDGWKSIGSILRGTDGEQVAGGGPKAMQTVGTWPVTESWG